MLSKFKKQHNNPEKKRHKRCISHYSGNKGDMQSSDLVNHGRGHKRKNPNFSISGAELSIGRKITTQLI